MIFALLVGLSMYDKDVLGSLYVLLLGRGHRVLAGCADALSDYGAVFSIGVAGAAVVICPLTWTTLFVLGAMALGSVAGSVSGGWLTGSPASPFDDHGNPARLVYLVEGNGTVVLQAATTTRTTGDGGSHRTRSGDLAFRLRLDINRASRMVQEVEMRWPYGGWAASPNTREASLKATPW